MTKIKSFQIRALSALVAVACIFCLYYFLNVQGLKITVIVTILIGILELTQILFKAEKKQVQVAFGLSLLATFGVGIFFNSATTVFYSITSIVWIIFVLLSRHQNGNLQDIMTLQMKGLMGLLYMGLLPVFAYRILDSHQGAQWFLFLLAVVFAGDTFAYLTGVLIGKNKIMPNISPQKTWEGSCGGLVGSMVAGLICWLFLFPEGSLLSLVILAAITGFIGQFGDFFESQLKRIANIKDSGKIMPGHGGILDRIDAVLFASPVVFAGILYL